MNIIPLTSSCVGLWSDLKAPLKAAQQFSIWIQPPPPTGGVELGRPPSYQSREDVMIFQSLASPRVKWGLFRVNCIFFYEVDKKKAHGLVSKSETGTLWLFIVCLDTYEWGNGWTAVESLSQRTRALSAHFLSYSFINLLKVCRPCFQLPFISLWPKSRRSISLN